MVTYAEQSDLSEVKVFDEHVSEKALIKAMSDERVLVFKSGGIVMGIARWNYFWDSITFLNMLYVPDGYTHCGIGTELLNFWDLEKRF